MAVLDLLFFGELLTAMILLTSRNARRFSSDEFEVMKSQSNDYMYLKSVRIIENSWLSKMGARLGKRQQLGLGVGGTIHFSREIDSENRRDLTWLVHETAHTLQYKYRELIYIPEALIAQRYSGCSFGGKETIISADKIRRFNPEQQAEIFTALTLSKVESELRQEIIDGNW